MESKAQTLSESQMIEAALAVPTMLTMVEFVQVTGFDISPFMMDRFWHTLRNKQPIYVDDELIKWMGYEASEAKERKKAFRKLLATLCDLQSIEMSNDKYEQFLLELEGTTVPSKIYPLVDRSHGKSTTKHLLLDEKLLKKTMMKCNTKRGDKVREYYIALEELATIYTNYQTEFKIREARSSSAETLALIAAKDAEIAAKAAELEKVKADALIDRGNLVTLSTNYLHEAGGYIYIGSTYAQHLKHYYKIGKTVSINKRLIDLNTNCLVDEGFVIIREFEVAAVGELETRIHRALKKFRHSEHREYFQCPYDHLVALVELISQNYDVERQALKVIINSLFINRSAQLALTDSIDPDIWKNPKITKCKTTPIVKCIDAEKCAQIVNESLERKVICGPSADSNLIQAAPTTHVAPQSAPVIQPIDVKTGNPVKPPGPPPSWAVDVKINARFHGIELFQMIRNTARELGVKPRSNISVTVMHDALRTKITPRKDYVNGAWAPVIREVLKHYGVTVTGVRS